MGYKKSKTIYTLKFEDEFDGLVVRARSLPLGKFMRLAPLVDMDIGDFSAEDVEKLDQLFELFSEALISWNIEEPVDPDDEDGPQKPVPATKEGLYSLELPEALIIIINYSVAVGGVSTPLAQPSSDGSPSLEAGIPVEANS